MHGPILVPVDDSKFAERALALAAPLADQHRTSLLIAHVHEAPVPLAVAGLAPVWDTDFDEEARRASRERIDRLARRTAKLLSTPVEGVYLEGRVVPTLLALARERHVGLVVMSTHGRGGFQRFWLGSVTDAIVRHAASPVLLVRGARAPQKRLAGARPFLRALVALDGSARAESAVEAAKGVLGTGAARIVLLHVVHPTTAAIGERAGRDVEREFLKTYLEPLARRTATDALEVRVETRVDANAVRTILAAAEQHDADCVALASQGMSGVQRLVVGSVADKLIRSAPVPVLVVPPSEAVATIHA